MHCGDDAPMHLLNNEGRGDCDTEWTFTWKLCHHHQTRISNGDSFRAVESKSLLVQEVISEEEQ